MTHVPESGGQRPPALAGARARPHELASPGPGDGPRRSAVVTTSEQSRRPGPDPQPITNARSAGLKRHVDHEMFDALTSDDAVARRFRRDLRILNRLLGNRSWLERALRDNMVRGEKVLELGAGTGDMRILLEKVATHVAGLDLDVRPSGWPEHAPWFETDVLAFDRWAEYPVVVANLLLHRFDPLGLARIGASIGAHARVLIASEPLRARRTAALFMTVCPIIGADAVTRHDGRVSIAAGMRGDELPHLLHLDPDVWRWQASETWRGSCRLVAVRR